MGKPLTRRELRLVHALLKPLEDMHLITCDPNDAQCCGLPRDESGRCQFRGTHPIYVEIPEEFDENA